MDARVWRKALDVTKETKEFAKFKAEAEADAGSVYHGLDEDALAEEVFARLCGKRGEELMEQEGLDTWAKVRRAVLDAFKTVLRTLGLSDDAVESLRFEDVRSMCLRDLMDDETFGIKGIRATATKGSRVRDAVDNAAADAGIKDASWKRKEDVQTSDCFISIDSEAQVLLYLCKSGASLTPKEKSHNKYYV